MYEIFEHTADLGMRVVAANLETLFVDAARGLFSIIVANLDEVRLIREFEIRVAGTAPDYLLCDWLSELLYLSESKRLLLAEFQVRLTDDGLVATARGEPQDRQRHHFAHEVKAVTYHGLKVEQTSDGWLAEVILDI